MKYVKAYLKHLFEELTKKVLQHDKLMHYFIGSLFYLLMKVFYTQFESFVITLIFAIIWEFVRWKRNQSINKPINRFSEMALDVFYSMLFPLIDYVAKMLNQIL